MTSSSTDGEEAESSPAIVGAAEGGSAEGGPVPNPIYLM
jgi:hypothetical protein